MKTKAKLLVSKSMGLRAILLEQPPTAEETKALLELGGPDFRGDIPLAKRWGFKAVFCPADFGGSEMARKGKPAGLWEMELQTGG